MSEPMWTWKETFLLYGLFIMMAIIFAPLTLYWFISGIWKKYIAK